MAGDINETQGLGEGYGQRPIHGDRGHGISGKIRRAGGLHPVDDGRDAVLAVSWKRPMESWSNWQH